MKNQYRAEQRYLSRKAKRDSKKEKFLSQFTYDKILDIELIQNAVEVCRRGVDWKNEIIYYLMHEPFSSYKLLAKLEEKDFSRQPLKAFTLNERGKQRDILAPRFSERILQRVICEQILHKILKHYLIFDNGASQKGKGVDFTRKRIIKHLHNFDRENGNNGYILVMDFSKYFQNINHNQLFKMLDKIILDNDLKKLIISFVNQFDEGLGLGSQVSQDLAIFFTTKLDNYIKCQLSIKYYARYMDDSYALFKTKEEAENALAKIKKVCESMGIILNLKKTKILELQKGFCFMHRKYKILKNGKIIVLLDKRSIKHEKRKLRKQFKLGLDLKSIEVSYTSWEGGTLDCFQNQQLLRFKEKVKNIFKEQT